MSNYKYQAGEGILTLLIAYPIVALIAAAILIFFGFLTLTFLVGTLLNFTIIGLSVGLVLMVFLFGRITGRVITLKPIQWGIAAGFLFWLYNVYTAFQSNVICNLPVVGQTLCSIGSALSVPILLVDAIAFIIWISISKAIIKGIFGG